MSRPPDPAPLPNTLKAALIGLWTLLPPLSVLAGLGVAPWHYTLLLCLAAGYGLKRATTAIESSGLIPALIGLSLLLPLWCAISATWAIEPERSLDHSARLAAVTVMCWLGIGWHRRIPPPAARTMLGGLGVGFLVALALAGFEWQSDLVLTRRLRALTGSDPGTSRLSLLNRGACVLALLVWPLVASLYASTLGTGRWRRRLASCSRLHRLAGALGLLATLGALLTQLESLSALFAWATGLSAAALARVVPRPGRVPVFVGLLWLAVSGFFLLLHTLPPATTLLREWPSFLEMSAFHRLVMWQFALEQWLHQPILGFGADMTAKLGGGNIRLYVHHEGIEYALALMPSHTHNLWLQLALELGVIGLGGVLLLVTTLIVWLARNLGRRDFAWAMAGLTSYLTVAWFGYGAWQWWWMAAGYALIAALQLHRRADTPLPQEPQ